MLCWKQPRKLSKNMGLTIEVEYVTDMGKDHEVWGYEYACTGDQ